MKYPNLKLNFIQLNKLSVTFKIIPAFLPLFCIYWKWIYHQDFETLNLYNTYLFDQMFFHLVSEGKLYRKIQIYCQNRVYVSKLSNLYRISVWRWTTKLIFLKIRHITRVQITCIGIRHNIQWNDYFRFSLWFLELA